MSGPSGTIALAGTRLCRWADESASAMVRKIDANLSYPMVNTVAWIASQVSLVELQCITPSAYQPRTDDINLSKQATAMYLPPGALVVIFDRDVYSFELILLASDLRFST